MLCWNDEVSMTILVICGGLIAPVLITELMADNWGIHLEKVDGRALSD